MTEVQRAPEIGLQLYTVRDLFVSGAVEDTFRQIAEIGYSNVELAGLCGRTAEEIKSILDQFGMRAVSTHEPLDVIESEPEEVVSRARLFGYDLVAVPWLAEAYRTPEGYRDVAARLVPACVRLARDGITLMWHNHAFEFEPLPDGSLPEDLLLSAGVAAELDVYWVRHAGLDPLDWMARYSGRIPILHVKDMTAGRKDFTEVGAGVLDLARYVREAPKHGVRYLVVEQDSNWTVSPMESARVGFGNLTTMVAR